MDVSKHDRSEMLISLTSDIVAAHLSSNTVSTGEVGGLITSVYTALSGLGSEPTAAQPTLEPAVSIRASVKKDHLVCLECGKKLKVLRRHLSAEHGMSPEEYRDRWSLSADYPMVASDYASRRRDLAMEIGLGRKPGQRRGRRKMVS